MGKMTLENELMVCRECMLYSQGYDNGTYHLVPWIDDNPELVWEFPDSDDFAFYDRDCDTCGTVTSLTEAKVYL